MLSLNSAGPRYRRIGASDKRPRQPQPSATGIRVPIHRPAGLFDLAQQRPLSARRGETRRNTDRDRHTCEHEAESGRLETYARFLTQKRSSPARLARKVSAQASAPGTLAQVSAPLSDNYSGGSSGTHPLAARWVRTRSTSSTVGRLIVSELQSPSAAAGLRREFSPARPPGLGGGHRALGLADAVAHEPCGGSPVQGYKG
jgi:hypothetical protein